MEGLDEGLRWGIEGIGWGGRLWRTVAEEGWDGGIEMEGLRWRVKGDGRGGVATIIWQFAPWTTRPIKTRPIKTRPIKFRLIDILPRGAPWTTCPMDISTQAPDISPRYGL